MTDILSPSPYAYLDALTPSERQAAIARRQHSRREDWCDDARRARDYQAELAETKKWEQFYCSTAGEWEANAKESEEQLSAAHSRIAELEAALEPLAKFSDMLKRQPIQGNGGILYALHMGTEDQAVLYEKDCHAARAALRK